MRIPPERTRLVSEPTISDETLSMTLSSLETSKEASQVVTTIPGYELRRELGRGSFGIVWEAVRAQTGQRVALKLVLHERRLNWDYFRRELALLVDLEDHPYTLTVLDADLGHHPPYIVTPLVEGGSLLSHQDAPLPQVIRWIEQTAEALHYIHSKGVIHCDLKPSNIFVTNSQSIRVGDLGQSRRVVDGEMAWGTIGYMAPEQCNQPPGKRITPSVLWDVYGFGATAYWMLTRQRARIRESDQARLASATGANQLASYYSDCLQQNPIVPIRSLNPKVDRELAAIVESCLRLDPARRPQSMDEVVQDLQRRRRGERLHCLRPWKLSYLLRWALGQRSFQFGILLVLVLWAGLLYGFFTYQQRQFYLLSQTGLHALESGRTEEAYLRWLGALRYRPGDPTTRARLSFLPVQMTYPDRGEHSCVAFSHTGAMLATASLGSSSMPNASARLWDARTGRQLAEIRHSASVQWVAFSPAEDLLVTASWDETGVAYDVAARKVRFEIHHDEALSEVLFSNDGKYLASTDQYGGVRLWESASGRRLPFESPSGDLVVQPIAFNPFGTELAALKTPLAVGLWDTRTGRPLKIDMSMQSEINDLHFHPTRPWLAAGGDDGSVTVWDTRNGKVVQRLKLTSRISQLRFSQTGDRLGAGCDDGTACLWNTDSWEPHTFPHARPVRSLNFSPDGNFLAVGLGEKKQLWSLSEPNGGVRVWDTHAFKAVTDTLAHDGPVNQVVFHPGRPLLAAASGAGLRVSSLYPGATRVWSLLLPEKGSWPVLKPPAAYQGKLKDDRVVISDLGVVRHGSKILINSFAFSQDNRLLATGAEDFTARLWSLPACTPRSRPMPHEGPVRAVAFNSDGKWLATAASSDSGTTVRIWDASDGSAISPPLFCAEAVTKLSFTPDDTRLVGNDGACVWTVQPPARQTDGNLREETRKRLKADIDESGQLVPVVSW